METAKAHSICIRCGQEIVPGQEVEGTHGLRHHAGQDLPACEYRQEEDRRRIAAAADPRQDGRHADSRRYGNVRYP